MYRDDPGRLRHMLEAAEEVQTLMEGRDRSALDSDRVLALAVVKLIEIIGEAAPRVSPEFQAAHPEVPWREIIGTRHRLIHDYDRINYDVVWDIISVDLPASVPTLRRLVNK